jgi:flagellar motility protein MotE (MotC chaperone)
MDKLKDCLQSMDPMEAARIMHAVQMMQAMDSMLKRRKSRSDEEEGGAW